METVGSDRDYGKKKDSMLYIKHSQWLHSVTCSNERNIHPVEISWYKETENLSYSNLYLLATIWMVTKMSPCPEGK